MVLYNCLFYAFYTLHRVKSHINIQKFIYSLGRVLLWRTVTISLPVLHLALAPKCPLNPHCNQFKSCLYIIVIKWETKYESVECVFRLLNWGLLCLTDAENRALGLRFICCILQRIWMPINQKPKNKHESFMLVIYI